MQVWPHPHIRGNWAGHTLNNLAQRHGVNASIALLGLLAAGIVVITAAHGQADDDYTLIVDSSAYFVTTWETTAPGESITIPVGGAPGIYTVDWGDENTTAHVGDATHAYEEAGIYTVLIYGDFTGIVLGTDSINAAKLRSIDQWGNAKWTTMESAFEGAPGMTYRATDIPDLSGVASTESMFAGASLFNGDISAWDVSSVADMGAMFAGASSFNGDISAWDVSSVADMSAMFAGASSFNGDISAWDVSSVADMSSMFVGAASFDSSLSTWDVSSVTTTRGMFAGASTFDGNISTWDVSSVADMGYMFNGASSFNGDLSAWDVSSVADMESMFNGASSFNGDLSAWDVSSVADMGAMFYGAPSFNGDLTTWNVSSANTMSAMFDGASSFEQNLGRWYIVLDDTELDRDDPTGTVTTISAQNRFLGGQNPTYSVAAGGDGDLFEIVGGNTLRFASADHAKTAYEITIMSNGGFGSNNSRSLTINITDTVNPTLVSATYYAANSTIDIVFSEPLNGTIHYDRLHIRDASQDAGGMPLYAVPAGYRTSSSNTITVTLTADQDSAFGGLSIPVLDVDVGAISDTYGNTFAAPGRTAVIIIDPSTHFVTTWETTAPDESIAIPVGGATGTYTVDWGDGSTTTHAGNATHTYNAAGNHTVRISGNFTGIILGTDAINAAKLISIDQWGSAKWATMESAFEGASGMTYRATDIPDLSGVNSTESMFAGASAFNGDLSAWDVSSVVDMNSMFAGASSFNGDLSTWDVSSVADMNYMFSGASAFNGDISAWDVSSVAYMHWMFQNATSFDGDISAWDVSSVVYMDRMFAYAASFDGDISRWDVSSVTRMGGMFAEASAFNGDLSGWDVSSVTYMNFMFAGAPSFDGDISGWDVSSVTDMHQMFQDATSFDGDISAWDVSSVTRMDFMLNGASSFNGDISGWDVSSVVHMDAMFAGASSFDGDISGWDVSSANTMGAMFAGAPAFTQNLGGWYIVPGDTELNRDDPTGTVTTISAQNRFLDGQNPTYSVAAGGDGDLFEITDENTLRFVHADHGKITYEITIMSDGGFGYNNSQSVIIAVTDTG